MKRIPQKDLNRIKESKLFDPDWYLKTYSDVEFLELDPARHYLKYGGLLNRDPSQLFSSSFYFDFHPNLKRNGVNPLSHYLTRKKPTKFDPKKVLWASFRLAETGKYDLAIDLAEKHLSDKLKNTVSLLKANRSLKCENEGEWLHHLNDYLCSVDSFPVQLSGKGSLLERLSTQPLPVVEDGELITVIMAAWNSEKTVVQAARSILNQTWRNIELIIVDDASQDSTWDIISRLAKEDSRVRVLRNAENVGPYVSRNVALTYASGAYVTVQDSDDWSHPQRIEKQTVYLLETGQVACLSGMLRVANNGELVSINKVGPNTRDGACRAAFVSLMVCRQFFKDVLGYWDNVRFGGDSELIKRIEKVTGRDIKKLHTVTMICLDNPDGLTNHPVYGHSQSAGVSKVRVDYKNHFLAWHDTVSKKDCRIDIVHWPRKFPIPEQATNPIRRVENVLRKHRVDEGIDVNCDVCIITNLSFPGGNASSTLDEVRYFKLLGWNVALVHCPIDGNIGKKKSNRFLLYRDIVVNWTDVREIKCSYLIVRHPAVALSSFFSSFKGKIKYKESFFVINNSAYRTNGDLVYDPEELFSLVKEFSGVHAEICPIGPVIRSELEVFLHNSPVRVNMSERDWTPTFEINSYQLTPKEKIGDPVVIGRHGRDGAEKWLEKKELLDQVYPDSSKFKIYILGGAYTAEKIKGVLSSNWEVVEFGGISPLEYLKELDVFVYFPNSNLSEAFGRTIVEAMFAGVPCVLPESFRKTFGSLAIYTDPANICHVIENLKSNDDLRVRYLREVQTLSMKNFSSEVIGNRVGVEDSRNLLEPSVSSLPLTLMEYKEWVEGV